MNFSKRLRVKPGDRVRLTDWDADDTHGFDKEDAEKLLKKNIERLSELEYRLYAENKRSLLIVLQGMDASGKDGTVRHVMSGLNPQSCKVTSFKVPSTEERAHDFLWRIHRACPTHGEIGIFNRSHYEDVLVVRVHKLAPKAVWSKRYGQINEFERILSDNNTTVLKFFLHIDRREQGERLKARLDDPNKNWKLTSADIAERKLWDDYQRAYEDVLTKCSTKPAAWYIIPANKKWFRNIAVSQIVTETLEELNPKFPKPEADVSKLVIK